MKNLFLLIIFAALTLACGSKTNQQNTEIKMGQTYLMVVGTYTENPEEGINIVKFSPEHNLMETVSIASDVNNPSFVITNENQNLVFAVEETGSDQGGKVTSFRLNKATQTMEKINSVFTKGNSPCHLSLDPSGSFLIASNYSGGNVTAIPVDQKGNLSGEVQSIQHSGSSSNPNRQKNPHVHSAVFHPQESKIFVADLGTDKINVYHFDKDSSTPMTLAEESSFKVMPGSGPRHMAFNKEGNRLYLIHELTAEVGVYAYEDEKLSHLETQPLTPEGFQGKVGAAEVRVSADGKFIYASNRGDANDITAFQIEEETGKLSKIQNISSQGNGPRNFAITPDGKYLICGNQNSDNLVVFNRNPDTGQLDSTDISLTIKKPVYITFLN